MSSLNYKSSLTAIQKIKGNLLIERRAECNPDKRRLINTKIRACSKIIKRSLLNLTPSAKLLIIEFLITSDSDLKHRLENTGYRIPPLDFLDLIYEDQKPQTAFSYGDKI